MKKNILKITILTSLIVLSGCSSTTNQANNSEVSIPSEKTSEQEYFQIETSTKLTAPIDQALSRVTKKPFGIYVTPDNSPVSPERFSGYHTGVDFEIFEDEKDKDVPIYAVCSGPLVYKNIVNGYGGVAIQYCELNNEEIAVLYGHLKLSSIEKSLNESIKAGSQIGILGKGESAETDGERKHLHLGIHKNGEINLRGYVQNEEDLKDWIDITKYLK